MQKALILFFCLLFISIGTVVADTITVSGNQSGVWSADTVLVIGEVTVPAGDTLIVEPGADVIFQGRYKLVVNGWLLAEGTETDSLLFTAADTSEGWQGIRFVDTPDSSRLSYCVIQYGRFNESHPDTAGGGVYCWYSNPIIRHCTIQFNQANYGSGVSCLYSHPTIADNLIQFNFSNWYYNYGKGGGIYCYYSNAVIHNNTIQGNVTPRGGGICCHGSNALITDNLIQENSGTGPPGAGGGGIYLDAGSDATISGNTIRLHMTWYDGGGIYCIASSPVITNNLITENQTGMDNSYGGGIFIGSGSDAEIAYNDIYDNQTEHGAGISCQYSNVLIEHNDIAYNYAGPWFLGYGAGVEIHFSTATLSDNNIHDNESYYWAGGVYLSFTDAAIRNNVIANNYAANTSGLRIVSGSVFMHNNLIIGNSSLDEGAVYSTGDVTVVNNTICNNTSYPYGTVWGLATVISNCVFWGNSEPQLSEGLDVCYSNIQGNDVYPGMGNINLDPQFVTGPQGDYYLSQFSAGQAVQSPCVDAAHPDSTRVEGSTRSDGVPDYGILDMGYHYALTEIYPSMLVDLTYVSGSPVPPEGGDLVYDVCVENASGYPQDYDAWIDICYEGGDPTTIAQRTFAEYLPGWTIDRPGMLFPVPEEYAAGMYTLVGRVGELPDIIWNGSGFAFEKSGQFDVAEFIPWPVAGAPNPFLMADETDAYLPTTTGLVSIYPNPFNPTTTISFDLPVAGEVVLQVFDVNGRLVSGEYTGSPLPAGHHTITFDGSHLSSGIYVYRLTAGDFTGVGKMVLMK